MRPEAPRMTVGVTFTSRSPPIIMPGSMPGWAFQSITLSMAATGTPTKFTKSLPAKAKASANVPARMITGKMFIRKKRIRA